MADPNLDELNTVTKKRIYPGIVDNYFKSGPIMAYVKANRSKIFEGGTLIQENFLFAPMKTDFYAKGGQFNVTKRQNEAGLQFTLKFLYANITEFPEDIEVFMRTPYAAFDKVKTDFGNAALSLSAKLEIAIMQHGQNLPTGDRSLAINGFEEALNNGVDPSYNGNLFPSYGGQVRADVGDALWPAGGKPGSNQIVPANVNGAITNRVLEHSFQSASIGEEAPTLGITTNKAVGFINENYMPLQRLTDTKDPNIGWNGLKFKGATILASRYMPGTEGVNDPDLGNYYNAAGEVFMWLNPGGTGDDAYFHLHTSASKKFQFGFTGFKVQQDGNQVAGQTLWSGNFSVRSTRLMRILFGITG